MAIDNYPPYQYLYQSADNPLTKELAVVILNNQAALQSVRNTPFRKSIEAEKVILTDMTALGFIHSVTNRSLADLFPQGLNFEVDFFHPDLQIGVEVEKGEVANIWKNICKFAESPLIKHGVLIVPVIRQGQSIRTEFYANTIKKLSGMRNIYTLMDSLWIIGY